MTILIGRIIGRFHASMESHHAIIQKPKPDFLAEITNMNFKQSPCADQKVPEAPAAQKAGSNKTGNKQSITGKGIQLALAIDRG